MSRGDKLVRVCDQCGKASCWYGEFMCEDAHGADLKVLTVADLRPGKRESEDYWTDRKMIEIYGDASREFRT